jgi:hypothetical protein
MTCCPPPVKRHFEDPANGLGWLFADVALDRIESVEPLSGADGFRVRVRMYHLWSDAMSSEELTLRPGTNLSGDECPLLVDDARTIGGGTD